MAIGKHNIRKVTKAGNNLKDSSFFPSLLFFLLSPICTYMYETQPALQYPRNTNGCVQSHMSIVGTIFWGIEFPRKNGVGSSDFILREGNQSQLFVFFSPISSLLTSSFCYSASDKKTSNQSQKEILQQNQSQEVSKILFCHFLILYCQWIQHAFSFRMVKNLITLITINWIF